MYVIATLTKRKTTFRIRWSTLISKWEMRRRITLLGLIVIHPIFEAKENFHVLLGNFPFVTTLQGKGKWGWKNMTWHNMTRCHVKTCWTWDALWCTRNLLWMHVSKKHRGYRTERRVSLGEVVLLPLKVVGTLPPYSVILWMWTTLTRT